MLIFLSVLLVVLYLGLSVVYFQRPRKLPTADNPVLRKRALTEKERAAIIQFTGDGQISGEVIIDKGVFDYRVARDENHELRAAITFNDRQVYMPKEALLFTGNISHVEYVIYQQGLLILAIGDHYRLDDHLLNEQGTVATLLRDKLHGQTLDAVLEDRGAMDSHRLNNSELVSPVAERALTKTEACYLSQPSKGGGTLFLTLALVIYLAHYDLIPLTMLIVLVSIALLVFSAAAIFLRDLRPLDQVITYEGKLFDSEYLDDSQVFTAVVCRDHAAVEQFYFPSSALPASEDLKATDGKRLQTVQFEALQSSGQVVSVNGQSVLADLRRPSARYPHFLMVSACVAVIAVAVVRPIPDLEYESAFAQVKQQLLGQGDAPARPIAAAKDWSQPIEVGEKLTLTQPRVCQDKTSNKAGEDRYATQAYCSQFHLPLDAKPVDLVFELEPAEQAFVEYMQNSFTAGEGHNHVMSTPTSQQNKALVSRLDDRVTEAILVDMATVLAPFCSAFATECDAFKQEFQRAWWRLAHRERCDAQACWQQALSAEGELSQQRITFFTIESFKDTLLALENAIWQQINARRYQQSVAGRYVAVTLRGAMPDSAIALENRESPGLAPMRQGREWQASRLLSAIELMVPLALDPLTVRVLNIERINGATTLTVGIVGDNSVEEEVKARVWFNLLVRVVALLHLVLFIYLKRPLLTASSTASGTAPLTGQRLRG
uniref:hypothetical protein n=1 Tax=Thaumasiovibrio occultus TaxID=1891184 RepID=UPI000B35D9B4|nr:hypothetical protein [Thaumasiovibrio occultus]